MIAVLTYLKGCHVEGKGNCFPSGKTTADGGSRMKLQRSRFRLDMKNFIIVSSIWHQNSLPCETIWRFSARGKMAFGPGCCKPLSWARGRNRWPPRCLSNVTFCNLTWHLFSRSVCFLMKASYLCLTVVPLTHHIYNSHLMVKTSTAVPVELTDCVRMGEWGHRSQQRGRGVKEATTLEDQQHNSVHVHSE